MADSWRDWSRPEQAPSTSVSDHIGNRQGFGPCHDDDMAPGELDDGNIDSNAPEN